VSHRHSNRATLHPSHKPGSSPPQEWSVPTPKCKTANPPLTHSSQQWPPHRLSKQRCALVCAKETLNRHKDEVDAGKCHAERIQGKVAPNNRKQKKAPIITD